MKLFLIFLISSAIYAMINSYHTYIASKNNMLNRVKSFKHFSSDTSSPSVYDLINSKLQEGIKAKASKGEISPEILKSMGTFLDEYATSNKEAKINPETFQKNLLVFLTEVQNAFKSPYQFKPFHKAVREPFDFYKWGNDFLRPLVIENRSKVFGLKNLEMIQSLLAKGENVLLTSNHQTEADPQVISILLEDIGLSSLAEKIIFIAGHKVTNDPIAIPFSMGRNLVCIHSKKHIKNPIEEFEMKTQQNLESMSILNKIVSEGGNIIWVAPSGGRDRPDEETGEFTVAPFDLKALDMFKLLSIQSKKPMTFFPMAMYTHQLVPPPKSVSSTVGEERSAKRGAVSICILDPMDGLGGLKDKEYRDSCQNQVTQAYKDLTLWHGDNI